MIKGTVQQIMPKVTGQGKNGEWGFVPIVIQTEGKYGKQIYLEVWDKKEVKSFKNADGVSLCGTMVNLADTIEVSYDLESRNYKDKNDVVRWTTTAKAYSIKVVAHREGQTQINPPTDDTLPF